MTEPYFREGNMTGQEFFASQVDASNAFEEPFQIQRLTDIEKIKQLCELCQIQEEGFCCPEHCCDWDSCRCNECQNCKIRRQLARKNKHEQEQTIDSMKIKQDQLSEYAFNVVKDPKIKLITEEGDEQITTIKRKKILKYEGCDDKKMQQNEVPQEQIFAGDLVIKNYEVDFDEAEPELKLLGGIRGIRALRVQRDYMQDVEQNQQQMHQQPTQNRFARYETQEEEKK